MHAITSSYSLYDLAIDPLVLQGHLSVWYVHFDKHMCMLFAALVASQLTALYILYIRRANIIIIVVVYLQPTTPK